MPEFFYTHRRQLTATPQLRISGSLRLPRSLRALISTTSHLNKLVRYGQADLRQPLMDHQCCLSRPVAQREQNLKPSLCALAKFWHSSAYVKPIGRSPPCGPRSQGKPAKGARPSFSCVPGIRLDLPGAARRAFTLLLRPRCAESRAAITLFSTICIWPRMAVPGNAQNAARLNGINSPEFRLWPGMPKHNAAWEKHADSYGENVDHDVRRPPMITAIQKNRPQCLSSPTRLTPWASKPVEKSKSAADPADYLFSIAAAPAFTVAHALDARHAGDLG